MYQEVVKTGFIPLRHQHFLDFILKMKEFYWKVKYPEPNSQSITKRFNTKWKVFRRENDVIINGAAHFKNVNNCYNTNIYSYLETSGGQSSKIYLNVVHFFNASVK